LLEADEEARSTRCGSLLSIEAKGLDNVRDMIKDLAKLATCLSINVYGQNLASRNMPSQVSSHEEATRDAADLICSLLHIARHIASAG